MTLSRALMIVFSLVAIFGALMTRGVIFGEGGWQSAVGITVLVTGALGVFNVIFFTRLKRSLEQDKANAARK